MRKIKKVDNFQRNIQQMSRYFPTITNKFIGMLAIIECC